METLPSPNGSKRPGVEAFPVTLADGKSWGLALPSPRLRPEVVEGVDGLGRPSKTIRLVTEFGYPLEIRRLVEALRSSCDRDEAGRQYESLIHLAAALICRAHDIDLSEAVSLLEMGVDDVSELVEAVLSVVSGGCLADPNAERKGEVDG